MAKRRLFHIALGTHNDGLWKSFDKEFKCLHFDWTPHQKNIHALNRKIIQLFDEFEPHYVFMQIQKGGIIRIPTVKHMVKDAIVVNWTGDVRYPVPEWYLNVGEDIDSTLFTNTTDVNTLNRMGITSDFLQVGFDRNVYKPTGKNMKSPAIVFLASNYEQYHAFPLTGFRQQVVMRLQQEFGNAFGVYGYGWSRYSPSTKFLNQEEEAAVYRNCKVAINISHFNYGRYSSDRMLRIMGSGAFCLSHHFKDLETDYKIGKHLDVFTDANELVKKVKHYIRNTSKREKIAKSGCSLTRRKYCWDTRAKELKEIFKKYE